MNLDQYHLFHYKQETLLKHRSFVLDMVKKFEKDGGQDDKLRLWRSMLTAIETQEIISKEEIDKIDDRLHKIRAAQFVQAAQHHRSDNDDDDKPPSQHRNSRHHHHRERSRSKSPSHHRSGRSSSRHEHRSRSSRHHSGHAGYEERKRIHSREKSRSPLGINRSDSRHRSRRDEARSANTNGHSTHHHRSKSRKSRTRSLERRFDKSKEPSRKRFRSRSRENHVKPEARDVSVISSASSSSSTISSLTDIKKLQLAKAVNKLNKECSNTTKFGVDKKQKLSSKLDQGNVDNKTILNKFGIQIPRQSVSVDPLENVDLKKKINCSDDVKIAEMNKKKIEEKQANSAENDASGGSKILKRLQLLRSNQVKNQDKTSLSVEQTTNPEKNHSRDEVETRDPRIQKQRRMSCYELGKVNNQSYTSTKKESEAQKLSSSSKDQQSVEFVTFKGLAIFKRRQTICNAPNENDKTKVSTARLETGTLRKSQPLLENRNFNGVKDVSKIEDNFSASIQQSTCANIPKTTIQTEDVDIEAIRDPRIQKRRRESMYIDPNEIKIAHPKGSSTLTSNCMLNPVTSKHTDATSNLKLNPVALSKDTDATPNLKQNPVALSKNADETSKLKLSPISSSEDTDDISRLKLSPISLLSEVSNQSSPFSMSSLSDFEIRDAALVKKTKLSNGTKSMISYHEPNRCLGKISVDTSKNKKSAASNELDKSIEQRIVGSANNPYKKAVDSVSNKKEVKNLNSHSQISKTDSTETEGVSKSSYQAAKILGNSKISVGDVGIDPKTTNSDTDVNSHPKFSNVKKPWETPNPKQFIKQFKIPKITDRVAKSNNIESQKTSDAKLDISKNSSKSETLPAKSEVKFESNPSNKSSKKKNEVLQKSEKSDTLKNVNETELGADEALQVLTSDKLKDFLKNCSKSECESNLSSEVPKTSVDNSLIRETNNNEPTSSISKSTCMKKIKSTKSGSKKQLKKVRVQDANDQETSSIVKSPLKNIESTPTPCGSKEPLKKSRELQNLHNLISSYADSNKIIHAPPKRTCTLGKGYSEEALLLNKIEGIRELSINLEFLPNIDFSNKELLVNYELHQFERREKLQVEGGNSLKNERVIPVKKAQRRKSSWSRGVIQKKGHKGLNDSWEDIDDSSCSSAPQDQEIRTADEFIGILNSVDKIGIEIDSSFKPTVSKYLTKLFVVIENLSYAYCRLGVVFQCIICSHKNPNKATFVQHLLTHIGNEILWNGTCTICKMESSENQSLVDEFEHLLSHSEQKDQNSEMNLNDDDDDDVNKPEDDKNEKPNASIVYQSGVVPNLKEWNVKPWSQGVKTKITDECCDDSIRLGSLYKCMDKYCAFYTNRKNFFNRHLLCHSTNENSSSDYLTCAYCNFKAQKTDLPTHIQIAHGNTSLQCGYCYFRAFSYFQLAYHQKTFHQHLELKILKCLDCPDSLPDMKKIRKDLEKKWMRPYICPAPNCGYKDFIRRHFEAHVLTHPKISLSCKICGQKCNITTTIEHQVNCSNRKEFTCVHCGHSSDTQDKMNRHFETKHLDTFPLFCQREFKNQLEGPENCISSDDLVIKKIHYHDIQLIEEVQGDANEHEMFNAGFETEY